jgi:hypothetical protein
MWYWQGSRHGTSMKGLQTTLITSQGTDYSVDLRETVSTTDGLQCYGDDNNVRHVAQVFVQSVCLVHVEIVSG